MRMRRILAGWMLILAIGAPDAIGRPREKLQSSSSFALLVAYASDQHSLESIDLPRFVWYKTLLIIGDSTGARIAATLPDVIVPRSTVFWRVGIEHACYSTAPTPGDPLHHGSIEIQDIVYAAPVDKTPAVEVESGPCDPETAQRVLDRSYVPWPSNRSHYEECGGIRAQFKTVLPDLVSISAAEADMCEQSGGHNYEELWVQSPDDPMPPFFETWQANSIPSATKIRFDQLFGAAGHKAWASAVSNIIADPDGDCGDDDPNVMQQTGWNLEHIGGEWRTTAYVNVGGVCEGLGHPRIDVPSSLTHAVPLPLPWSALKRQLPGISDAYFSPLGSVVLAVRSSAGPASNETHVASVALFDFSDGKIGQQLLDLPTADIVMTEWATGRFVKSWTECLTALQRRGLAAPVFHVKPQ